MSAMLESLLADPIANYPAATVACFDPTTGDLPRRALDEARTVAFLEKLGDAGAPAVLIAASTGHGHARTVEELEQWFRVAARRDSAARADRFASAGGWRGRQSTAWRTFWPTLAMPWPSSAPAATCRRARAMSKSSPTCSRRCQAIAERRAGRRPVFDSRRQRRADVARRCRAACRRPRRRSHRGHQGDRGQLRNQHAAVPSRTRGWRSSRSCKAGIRTWPAPLRDGPQHDAQSRQRCGVTSGPMSFAIFQYLHILQAAERGDWDEVAAAQSAVTALFQAMQDDPAKFADLQRAKYMMGLGHPLTGTVTIQQFEPVLKALDNLPRDADRERLADSLDLMDDGPFHPGLRELYPPLRKLKPEDSMPDSSTTLADLRDLVRRFVDERDWRQFHSPKNLSMSLAIEAAELMEHFQWIDSAESRRIGDDPAKLAAVRDEIADVLCYLLALANELDLDLSTAVRDKMVKNAAKYPAEQSRGRYAPPATQS